MSNCARRLHGVKWWGGKKQCLCNKDEYASYERVYDHIFKNA